MSFQQRSYNSCEDFTTELQRSLGEIIVESGYLPACWCRHEMAVKIRKTLPIICYDYSQSNKLRAFLFCAEFNATCGSLVSEKACHISKVSCDQKKTKRFSSLFLIYCFWQHHPAVVIRSSLADKWGDPTNAYTPCPLEWNMYDTKPYLKWDHTYIRFKKVTNCFSSYSIFFFLEGETFQAPSNGPIPHSGER